MRMSKLIYLTMFFAFSLSCRDREIFSEAKATAQEGTDDIGTVRAILDSVVCSATYIGDPVVTSGPTGGTVTGNEAYPTEVLTASADFSATRPGVQKAVIEKADKNVKYQFEIEAREDHKEAIARMRIYDAATGAKLMAAFAPWDYNGFKNNYFFKMMNFEAEVAGKQLDGKNVHEVQIGCRVKK